MSINFKSLSIATLIALGLGSTALAQNANLNGSSSESNTRSSSTGVGLSENANVNQLNPTTGISQDFSSDSSGQNIDNSRESRTYIAPDVHGPEANSYGASFSGQSSGQQIRFSCPSGGGVSFNIGTYLGGFGISTPSDQLPEDCQEFVQSFQQAVQVDTATMAANRLGGSWAKTFYEELLIQQMLDMGLARNRTQALIKLYRFNTNEAQPMRNPDGTVNQTWLQSR